MDVRFFTDPAAFLDVAAQRLASDPVRCSVIASVAERAVRHGLPGKWAWFAAVTGPDGSVEGVAMRTHPDPPHAGFALAMPDAAARALADALAARGEEVPAWNGDLAAGKVLLDAVAREREVQVRTHLRLFELREVVWPPRRPEGRLRVATPADIDLAAEWIEAFHVDSEVQGGREPVPGEHTVDRERLAVRLAAGEYRLWEVEGCPVHLTGVNAPSFGVRCVGPVYTPEAERGKGYAGWVVATLSQQVLDAGHRPCLYTDQANPVSNKVYERIGYVALGDEAELRLG